MTSAPFGEERMGGRREQWEAGPACWHLSVLRQRRSGECFTWHIMSNEESKAGLEDTQKESLVSVSGKMFRQLLYC